MSRADEVLVEKMLNNNGMDDGVSTADEITALHQVHAGVASGNGGGGGGGGGSGGGGGPWWWLW